MFKKSLLRLLAVSLIAASISFGTAETAMPVTTTAQTPIRGFADVHNHQFAYLGFGGKAFVGAAYGPINQALKWCDYGTGNSLLTPNWVHGPGGSRDFLGNILRVAAYGANFTGSGGHKVGGNPQFDGWPRWDSVTHQSVYEDWLLRALQGGMKLMVMLAVNNERMCDMTEKAQGRTCNDMEAVDLQLAEAKKMEAYIDAKSGGPGRGWYRIVRSPKEARDVIGQGKLAVVLGIEVDYLFNCRQENAGCTPAYVTTKLKQYYDLGVRHIYPIHFDNNAFGGASYDKDLHYDVNRSVVVTPQQFYPIKTRDCRAEGYQRDGGRCNSIGLTGTGQSLIRASIKQGMIVDVDHMSALAFKDTLDIAEASDWPVVSGHSGYLEISNGDRANEGNLSAAQIERIRKLGGLLSTIVRQGKLDETKTWQGPNQPVVEHTCGATSQTLVQAYLYAVSKMKGGPVAFGTDLNGYAGLPGPRFGADACPGGKPGGFGGPTNTVSYPFHAIATDAWLGRSVIGQKTFDFNTDGLAHVGMLPDLIADFEKMGLKEKDLAPLLNSAEGYIRMWEKIDSKKVSPTPTPTPKPLTRCQEQCADLKADCLAGDGRRPGNPGRCDAAYKTCVSRCR